MKRHVQLEGVRKWAGDHLMELEGQPLEVLDRFFGQYGSYVLAGCEVTPAADEVAAADGLVNVAPGLVVLAGVDAGGADAVRVVPFEGVVGVPLPIYLTLAWNTRLGEYVTGGEKPIAYDYYAAASTVEPAEGTAYLLFDADTLRFRDKLLPGWDNVAMQDGTYPNLTAGDSAKLGGEDAEEYVLREDLADKGFRFTDISGWTGHLNASIENTLITAQVTKPWRSDAFYLFKVSRLDPSQNSVINCCGLMLDGETIVFPAGSTYSQTFNIKCIDPQTMTITTGSYLCFLYRVYEILPNILK